MSLETETTRNAALALLPSAGWAWQRLGKGQRFVIRLERDGKVSHALVKTASRGGAIVKADKDDADNAKISGFSDDVEWVFFAVTNRNGSVTAYLVPIDEAEKAFRTSHKLWRAKRNTATENTTWVIRFDDLGDVDCNGFHRKWEKYIVTPGQDEPRRGFSKPGEITLPEELSIEAAKFGLAKRFGVSQDQVKIIIEY